MLKRENNLLPLILLDKEATAQRAHVAFLRWQNTNGSRAWKIIVDPVLLLPKSCPYVF